MKGARQMAKIMKKPEIARALAAKTDFYIKHMEEVVEALEEIIFESLQSATYDEPSEIHVATGVVIGGKRIAAHETVDPRNREIVITPEKVIPYATFKNSIRQKLYVRTKKKGKK
jgi:hypothetical protein